MAEVRWRLLVTDPLDGAANMALDEAMLLARIQGSTGPTLRFFAWDPPTVSLGYGQRLGGGIDLNACRALGVGLVRRPTGGSAIYHDTREREVTYSVVARAGDFERSDELLETYRWIGAGLTAGLRRLDVSAEMVPVRPSDPSAMPDFCFARTGSCEIEFEGKKLVGSAQRRQAGAFLQHGSVLIGADPSRLRRLFPQERDPLAGMTTLEAALKWRPAFDDVVEALTAGFRETHGLHLVLGGLAPEEEQLAARLIRGKYAAEAWTRHAQTPPTTDFSIPAVPR